jgi:hypothetical protein
MTKQQHKRALNCLKSINNLELHKNFSLKKGVIRYEYKHQVIHLDNMNMIVSGSWEQFNSVNHTKDMIFLVIALLDEDNQDVSFTPLQHEDWQNVLRTKLSIA